MAWQMCSPAPLHTACECVMWPSPAPAARPTCRPSWLWPRSTGEPSNANGGHANGNQPRSANGGSSSHAGDAGAANGSAGGSEAATNGDVEAVANGGVDAAANGTAGSSGAANGASTAGQGQAHKSTATNQAPPPYKCTKQVANLQEQFPDMDAELVKCIIDDEEGDIPNARSKLRELRKGM
ncbi:hypothetical protein DUNSADRAFT_4635 [Dunaliella salina]|uniref:CUE domain-containing protein n=1 Tax=Dunaliella salina TaxID=3046 RepID=A0ABQ7GRN5_DUNSA|nr:hypothetical protein DUNSADRAFT_4635 [Dunaliella salina]|eukprot:KAF5837244.1 hypothetical protein DUNSADRAFT_4635 [Dunaliella salina]